MRIGGAGVFAGILNPYLRVAHHLFQHYFLTDVAYFDTYGIVYIPSFGHFPRRIEFVCTSGKSQNHGKVVLLYTVKGNFQPLFRLERNVAGFVFRGIAAGIRIHPEYREIARVARPHPVVGIRTKLSDGRGRSTHQTYIAVLLGCKHIIFVAAVERFDLHAGSGIILQEFSTHLLFRQFVQIRWRKIIHPIRVRIGFQRFGNIFCNIVNLIDQGDCKSRIGKLLLFGRGPESVGKVIVFERTVLLYLAVPAMVIG